MGNRLDGAHELDALRREALRMGCELGLGLVVVEATIREPDPGLRWGHLQDEQAQHDAQNGGEA